MRSPPPVHLDFETFSELDLKVVGTCKLAEHPSTEVLCAAYAIGDEEPDLWTPDDPPPRRLFRQIARGSLVHAWNAEMEIPVWRDVCAARMGWPEVPDRQWRDTEAVALSLALPAALENCGAILGLEIQKDRRGHHVMRKLCKPRKPSKNNPATRWTPESVPQDYADLYSYCRQDVRAERAIYHALPLQELPPRELATWRLTVEMNLRGWTVDYRSVGLMLSLLRKHRARALKEIETLTDGEIQTDGQQAKILAWLSERGVDLPNYQKLTIEEALEGRLPRRARRLLELRRELGKSSVKKYAAMRARLCADGTVKNNLLYHGAGTGRDAGRGMQIQNFPRASISKTDAGVEVALRALRTENPLGAVEILYGMVPHFASMLLRPMLVAEEGAELFAADFGQVENRIAVWYADCAYGIKIFEDGLDEYVMFARDFYEVPYEEVTAPQRQHSKHAVLGCCFGLGWKGLMAQAKRFSAPTTRDVAEKMVDHYREVYAEVVAMWYGLERAAKRAVKEPGAPQKYHGVHFQVRDDFLFMKLASGRELAYYDPKVEFKPTPWGRRKWTVTHTGRIVGTKWGRVKISPGRFFENLVQATARDAMMHGAKATTRAGYDLVGRVHDELISEADEGAGSVEEYCRLMIDVPRWLDGIPIKATGWTGRRYKK